MKEQIDDLVNTIQIDAQFITEIAGLKGDFYGENNDEQSKDAFYKLCARNGNCLNNYHSTYHSLIRGMIFKKAKENWLYKILTLNKQQ